MLSVLALGVVVAATLLASAPIYARTMADMGLTFQIRQDLQDQPNTRIEFPNVPIQTQDGVALRNAVEKRINDRIGWFTAVRERYIEAPWMVTAKQGKAPVQTNPFGQLESLTDYAAHVTVTAGRLPQPTEPGKPIEVALGPTAFKQSGMAVGDTFAFYEDFDTCERALTPADAAPPPFPCKPQATVNFSYPAVLVGVIAPNDNADHFWVQGVGQYFDPTRPLDGAGPVLPMFTNESSLLNGFGSTHPGYRVTLAYNVFADPQKLSRTNYQRARTDIHALYDELSPIGGVAFSPLTTTLDRFGTSENYQQIPLTILLLEIAAVALFYVVLMSAVVVERQAMEIALLRSRGATIGQVISLYVLEGLVVGVPVMLVAPFLAAATTALLGLTPIFKDVAEYRLLPVTVLPQSFALAGLGVVLSLLALIGPAFVVSRRSAVSQRRAEGRPGVSLIQRYYLDFALVLIAGMLLWELNQRGSVFTPSASGGVSSDPLLLASPALIILAAAAMLLRLYPMVLRLAAKTFAAAAGVTVTIGLWQVVRSPGQYTRLTLLLMMAVAVGTFAASYSSTAERSYRDRADFETGVDWRATTRNEGTLGTNGSDADALLTAIPGVGGATSVLRTAGGLAVSGIGSQNLQVLALNPDVAPNYLWFRSDFADHSLKQLMDALGPSGELPGKALPGDPATLSVWVYTAESRDQLDLWAAVRDSTGQFDYLELGQLSGTGWRELQTPVHPDIGPVLVAPISIESLVMTQPANHFDTAKTPIYFDDVSVVSATGQRTVVEDFESGAQWAILPTRAISQNHLDISADQHHGGAASAKLTLHGGASGEVQGIFFQNDHIPLPAVVSQSFLAMAGVQVGSTTNLQIGGLVVPIVVRDSFKLFPTMSSADGPAIILNRDYLESWLRLSFGQSVPQFNEGWFTFAPGADRAMVAKTIQEQRYGLVTVFDRQQELATVAQNPLIAAGGSGILFVAFLAVLVLVAAALLVSLWMAVQRRRVEFAVLRALGVSRGQVFRLLAFEYALVAVVGMVAGSYLGLVVGRRMLSFLDVTQTGARVEPGFILETQWGVVIMGAAVVLAIFGVALFLATRLLARTSDAQALRLE